MNILLFNEIMLHLINPKLEIMFDCHYFIIKKNQSQLKKSLVLLGKDSKTRLLTNLFRKFTSKNYPKQSICKFYITL